MLNVIKQTNSYIPFIKIFYQLKTSARRKTANAYKKCNSTKS